MNQQQMPQQERPSMSPWLLAVFVIVLLVGGGYFVWYYYNQNKTTTTTPVATPATTDVTANWNTYSDTTYNFSFKYPKDWTASSAAQLAIFQAVTGYGSPESIKAVDDYNKAHPNSSPPTFSTDIAVSVFTSLEKYNENSSSDKSFKDSLANVNRYSSYSATTLGGQTAYDAVMMADNPTYVILAEKDGNIYRIMFPNIKAKTDLTKTETQILSSFKFATASTSDWKTFTDSTYGFSLTLTDNWQKYRYQIVKNQNSAESTVYFSLPTTDTKYKDATDKAPAGYAPVFHVNIFPIASYNTTTLGNDTLIQKTTKYAFTWSLETSIPTDVTAEAKTDVTTIIQSFKPAQ